MDNNLEIDNVTSTENNVIKTIPPKRINTSNLIEDIGFGKFQIISCIFFCFGMLLFGVLQFAWSFFNLVLQNEWNLSIYEVNILGSIFFFGFTVGSMGSGPLSDQYGRKNLYLFIIFSISLTSGLLGFAPNYIFFLVFWMIIGGLIGILFPLVMIMTIEISTIELRGKVTILVHSIFTLGELYGLLICYYTFTSFSTGNWRILFFFISIPCLIVGLIALFILKETPIFALQSDFNYGVEILNTMYKQNQGNDKGLSEDDIQQLKRSIEEEQRQTFQNDDCLKVFAGEFKYITPLLWIIFFASALVYAGCVYIYPITLYDLAHQGAQNQDFLSLFVSIVSEIPSYVLMVLTIDTALGRKMSLFWSTIIAGLALMVSYLTIGLVFMLLIALGRTLSNCGLNLTAPFAGEIYHTRIRATGLGICNALSGAGVILMPWILNAAITKEIMLPFMIIGACSVVTGIATFLLPYDTAGRALDLKYEAMNQGIFKL